MVSLLNIQVHLPEKYSKTPLFILTNLNYRFLEIRAYQCNGPQRKIMVSTEPLAHFAGTFAKSFGKLLFRQSLRIRSQLFASAFSPIPAPSLAAVALLLLLFRQSLRLHSRLLRICFFRQSLRLRSQLSRFRLCFCFANPCGLAATISLCQSLRLHSQFFARNPYEVSSLKNFRSVLGIGMVTQQIAQNCIFAQQHFFKIGGRARCRGRKAKTTGAYLST